MEAIHWRRAIRWLVDRIHVLKPIRFENLRRNELGSKTFTSWNASAPLFTRTVTQPPACARYPIPAAVE